MLRIVQNDPTLKILISGPALSGWSEVGSFMSSVSADFARLLHFDGTGGLEVDAAFAAFCDDHGFAMSGNTDVFKGLRRN